MNRIDKMNRAQTLSTLVKVAKLQQKLLTKLASKINNTKINFEFGDSSFDKMEDYYVNLKTTYSGTFDSEQFKVEINRKLFIKCDSEGTCREEAESYRVLDNLDEYKLSINGEELGNGDYIHDKYYDIYNSMGDKNFTSLLLSVWESTTFQEKLEKEKEECQRSHDDRAINNIEHNEHERTHEAGWV